MPYGFGFNFLDNDFTLLNISKVVGYDTLSYVLYSSTLHNNFNYNSMFVTAGLKQCNIINENSYL